MSHPRRHSDGGARTHQRRGCVQNGSHITRDTARRPPGTRFQNLGLKLLLLHSQQPSAVLESNGSHPAREPCRGFLGPAGRRDPSPFLGPGDRRTPVTQ
jgi:hypothetical protein